MFVNPTKNTTKLSEEKRQRPFSVDEAFRNDSRHSPFDVERIYQQMDYNEAADNLTVTGSFIWKNGQQDSKSYMDSKFSR